MKLKQRTLPPIQFTKAGYEKVKQEYAELLEKRKPTVDKVKTAREMGDLSENAAYHAARQNLSIMDGQLRHLKMQIVYGVVTESEDTNSVGLGSTVTVTRGNQEFVFTIVGDFEADPAKRNISINSPIGKTLLGKKVGDKVTVETPSGSVVYKVVGIA